jgi:hypothetical protein
MEVETRRTHHPTIGDLRDIAVTRLLRDEIRGLISRFGPGED